MPGGAAGWGCAIKKQECADHACKSTTTLFLRPVTCQYFVKQKKEKDGKITYKLKLRHDYYYQVQCQLYCDKKDWYDFVVRTEKELHVERIYRNTGWWDEQIPKLRVFYFEALSPELACLRHNKGVFGSLLRNL